MITDIKQVSINGTNNRYQIKKITTDKADPKKRIISEQWKLSEECYAHDKQLELLNDIFFDELAENKLTDSKLSDKDGLLKIMRQQINSKIYGYKRQDISKNLLNDQNFICFTDIICSLLKSELQCYYCRREILVLYDVARETTQWTVDRIDNNQGHNKDNYHIACLNCNLKRRRQSDDKFLFTKQLNIVKHY
jgi:hypothetical protein